MLVMVGRSAGSSRGVSDAETDAVMAACRVLVAVSAQSIAAAEQVVGAAQFRVLVIMASRGPVSLGGLAGAAGMHVSTASRICDRMVGRAYSTAPTIRPTGGSSRCLLLRPAEGRCRP